ncbi:phage terminase large subunit family protein [Halosolutus gelatinilyticus]|uniref:phage terminase large subunit family protein n=1 Tax=Halosolutus gelatinilyticus TaxID=2931975 RepID=UPI001FF0FF54|nr:phage terminase large subunit family protein [Halosolutus gelatinilyticus]
MTRPATERASSQPARRKSLLFCLECDHRSPIDGDWLREERGESVAYVCPACETTISERPRSTELESRRPRVQPATAWSRVLYTSIDVWRASVDAGLLSVAAMTPTRPRLDRA